jgi:hypothetical protein
MWERVKKRGEEQKKEEQRKERRDLPRVQFTPRPAKNGKGAATRRRNWKRLPKWCSCNWVVSQVQRRLPHFRGKAPPRPRRAKLVHHEMRISLIPTRIKPWDYGIRKSLPVQGGRVPSRNRLGQLLIDAARLYEEMANCRDKKLLKKYLHNEVPLHPHRTLDQYYYWIRNTSKNWDRDQVMYRSTTPGGFHEYDPHIGKWPQHDGQGITTEMGCDDCRANIRRTSRLVMVDQLWMWILNEQTIITCFPDKYGARPQTDTSSVHNRIRIRLQNAHQNQICSVFELALVIFDECSSTLFDRVTTCNEQPQVLDAFSEAIGNVVSIQCCPTQFIVWLFS